MEDSEEERTRRWLCRRFLFAIFAIEVFMMTPEAVNSFQFKEAACWRSIYVILIANCLAATMLYFTSAVEIGTADIFTFLFSVADTIGICIDSLSEQSLEKTCAHIVSLVFQVPFIAMFHMAFLPRQRWAVCMFCGHAFLALATASALLTRVLSNFESSDSPNGSSAVLSQADLVLQCIRPIALFLVVSIALWIQTRHARAQDLNLSEQTVSRPGKESPIAQAKRRIPPDLDFRAALVSPDEQMPVLAGPSSTPLEDQ